MRGDHIAQHSEDVLVYRLLHRLGDVPLRVNFACVSDGQLFPVLLGLLLDPLRPLLAPLAHFVQGLPASLGGLLLVLQLEGVVPLILVEVGKHLLLQLVGAVVDVDGVVVFIEALVHRFDRGLVQVPIH